MKQTRSLMMASLLALLYFFAQLAIAVPYRLYPGEDQKYLLSPFEWMHQPLFTFYIENWKIINWFLGQPAGDSLLLAMAFGNALTAAFVFLTLTQISKKALLGIAGFVLFSLSAWPTTYLWMASYTTWGTALSTGLFWGMLILRERIQAGKSSSSLLLFLGMIAGWGVLSSPSFVLILFLLSFGLYFLLPLTWEKKKPALAGFVLAACFQLCPFIIRTSYELVSHWYMNFFTDNFNFVPSWFANKPGVARLSFFRIASYYSGPLVWIFLVSSLIWIFSKSKLRQKDRFTTKVLLAVVAAYIFFVEVLPCTKLGRTHYAIFPWVVILVCLITNDLLSDYKTRLKIPTRGFSLVFILFYIGYGMEQITHIRETRRVKQSGAEFLENLNLGADFYVFEQDPHGESLRKWGRFESKKIPSLAAVASATGRRKVVLVGPTGPSSGRTALRASMVKDFEPREFGIQKPANATEFKLPFHAYYPDFLLEEEFSQAVFFAGMSPDYRNLDLQLTAWIWE